MNLEPAGGLQGRYSGDGNSIFRLAFVTSLLTLVTLGIYRFWAKTRIRKYIWSSISAGEDSFEYTGTGLEKLLGFLVAIVVLAVYLTVIQMLLFFFGLNVFTEPTTMQQAIAQGVAVYLTVLAIIPLWFFALYRARRYKMARTRWRGIRFGMEKGAWGYALRAVGYWVLTISTLGLLLPLQTFRLEKYMADRTWYGTAPFRQGGDWKKLYPAMKHLLIGIALLVGAAFAGGALESVALTLICGIVGYVWFFVGIVYYRVKAFTYLTETKLLDEEVQFTAAPQTGTIIKIVILGSLGIGLIAALLFGAAGAIFAVLVSSAGIDITPAAMILPLLVYGAALLATGALTLAMIIQPVIRHVVETVSIPNPDALSAIRQRAYDAGADAEGFADALDVGGAI